MSEARRWLGAALLVWMATVVAGIALRPILPVDEMRYLAVALEMWQRGDFLVPYRNGEAYHHKPPVLFWAMQAGWAVFGVDDFWGRLVAPLFGLGSLVLAQDLARRLFPGRTGTVAMAPLALLACAYFLAFGSLTYFDTLVTFFALGAWIGIVVAWQGRPAAGWGLVALSLGLGILSKGPVQLVHVVPLALLAPVWMTRDRPTSWPRWYGGFALALLGGAAVALAWAVPAAISGGEEFARKIFLGQHTGRVVRSFSHARPVWWYLPLLLGLLFPALWWLAPWRRLRGAAGMWREPGLRFAAVGGLSALVFFSSISGKQPHYMLPTFALFALVLARLADREDAVDRRVDRIFPALGLAAIGIALMGLRWIVARVDKGAHAAALTTEFAIAAALFGVVCLAAAVWLWRDRPRPAPARLFTIALSCAGLVLGANISLHVLSPKFEMGPTVEALAEAERSGRRIAIVGSYGPDFYFAGELRRPIEGGMDPSGAVAWARANPQGVVVRTYARRATPLPADWPRPLHLGSHRGRAIAVWPAAEIGGARGAELLSDTPP